MLPFMKRLAVLACFATFGIKKVTDVDPDYPANSPRIYGVFAIYFTLGISIGKVVAMPKYAVRFWLEEEPEKTVAEFIIDAPWENEAMALAHERWMTEYPEDSAKPFSYASTNA